MWNIWLDLNDFHFINLKLNQIGLTRLVCAFFFLVTLLHWSSLHLYSSSVKNAIDQRCIFMIIIYKIVFFFFFFFCNFYFWCLSSTPYVYLVVLSSLLIIFYLLKKNIIVVWIAVFYFLHSVHVIFCTHTHVHICCFIAFVCLRC